MRRSKQGPLRYRSIFISDIHLGTRPCQAEFLLHFLQSTHCDHLYLVGDIIDIESIRRRRRAYWPPSHSAVLGHLLGLARGTTQVIYIPGNHDHELRACVGFNVAGLEIHESYVHRTADGRRLWIVHGDTFGAAQGGGCLAACGGFLYDRLAGLDHWLQRARRWAKRPYWSLTYQAKRRSRLVTRYVERYEHSLVRAALDRDDDLHGVICGHIHQAEIRTVDGLLYANDGDWVESCTALVETFDGVLQLLRWAGEPRTLKTWAAPALATKASVAGIA